MAANKKISIRDVAAAVGYSATVVSHAMNDNPRVNEATRKRIKRQAAAMGYRPDVLARALVTRRTMLVGLVVPGLVTSFYPEVMQALKDLLEKHGYGLMVMSTDDTWEGEKRALDFLGRHHVDGLIVAPSQDSAGGAVYEAMVNQGTPVVLLDRSVPAGRCNSVASDNAGGAEKAIEHLVSLGHRRIGILRSGTLCSSTLERLAGCRQALAAHGLPWNENLVLAPAYNIGRDQYVAVDDLLGLLLSQPDPPTALFALHDTLAIAVQSAAVRMGIRIPRQLSLVGFDDLEIVKHLPVPLTSVAQDKHGLGRCAAELMLKAMTGDEVVTRSERLATRLVVRSSTGPRVEV